MTEAITYLVMVGIPIMLTAGILGFATGYHHALHRGGLLRDHSADSDSVRVLLDQHNASTRNVHQIRRKR